MSRSSSFATSVKVCSGQGDFHSSGKDFVLPSFRFVLALSSENKGHLCRRRGTLQKKKSKEKQA
eukprot:m.185613 g.185613  ORF g.185613 m.185613 type:complete len:64 (-) comp16686_c0_seq1:1278-1469(-)